MLSAITEECRIGYYSTSRCTLEDKHFKLCTVLYSSLQEGDSCVRKNKERCSDIFPQDVKVRFAMTRLFTNENIKPASPLGEEKVSTRGLKWDHTGSRYYYITASKAKSLISKKKSI